MSVTPPFPNLYIHETMNEKLASDGCLTVDVGTINQYKGVIGSIEAYVHATVDETKIHLTK